MIQIFNDSMKQGPQTKCGAKCSTKVKAWQTQGKTDISYKALN
jgi:hypothetical protein